MLTYEDFKTKIMKELPKILSGELGNAKIVQTYVYEINRKTEAITFEGLSKNLPFIRLPLAYSMYKQSEDFKGTLEMMETMLVMESAKALERAELLDFAKLREQVVFQFINTAQNKEYLEKLVHREYLDLSIVYRWVYAPEKDQSMILEKDFVEKFGISEEELYQLARVNTRKLFPIYAKAFSKLDPTYHNKSNEDIDLEDVTSQEKVDISSVQRKYGAIMILYDDVLQNIARKMDSDLYIMPLSMHEMVCSSVKLNQTPEELASILFCVNQENQDIDDRLSNQIYKYIKDRREIVQVTHTTHTMLENRAICDAGLPDQMDTEFLLTYEEFKELLANSIHAHLCDELLFCKTEIRQVDEKDCLYYIEEDFTMRICINELFSLYRCAGTMQEISMVAAMKINEAYKRIKELEVDEKLLKEHTIIQLISSEMSGEDMSKMTHRKFLDCLIVYRCTINADEEESSYFYVCDDMLKRFQMSEEDLYQCALKNLDGIFSPVLLPVVDAVKNRSMLPAFKLLQLKSRCDKTIYVVMNHAHDRGASCILADNVLQRLVSEYQSNFYIMPTSVDEVVVVPADAHSPDVLYMLLHIMNSLLLDSKKRISNNIYYYDIESKEFAFALKDVDVHGLLLDKPKVEGVNEDEVK